MAKEILVAYGVDVDAVGGWLGSCGGEDSPVTSHEGCSRVRWVFLACSSCFAVPGSRALVLARTFHRNLPRGVRRLSQSRPRDRCPRLQSRTHLR